MKANHTIDEEYDCASMNTRPGDNSNAKADANMDASTNASIDTSTNATRYSN